MRRLTIAYLALGFSIWQSATVTLAAEQQRRPIRGAADALRLAAAIDQQISAELAARRLAASPPADDAAFLRRLYLDLHGVIPTRGKALEFLLDPSAEKRSRVIDELLDSPRFGQHLADIWSEYLTPPNVNQRIPTPLFTAWLADAFNRLAWDELVYELLTATGSPEENAAIVYMLKTRDPVNPAEMANTSTRYFLGVQLGCAQCHDHPFTSYTKEDFWGIASFFSQFEMPGQGRVRRFAITDNINGSYHLANYEDRHELGVPRVLGAAAPAADRSLVLRPILARWVTSPDNPYFAKAMANRMWWHFFGRGLVEPVDDMHPDNPPSHAALLELLAGEFAAGGFDLRHLCRAILNSETYQRTSRPLEADQSGEQWYSQMPVKVLTPRQLYDSLVVVFGAPGRLQPGVAARYRNDPRAEFAAFFAREPNASPLSYEHGIPQLLRMMNSAQFAEPAQGAGGSARGGAAPAPEADDEIEELYLRVLSRLPTADELALCKDHLERGGRLREILWALVNSSQFCLNY